MALIECKECKAKISSGAKTCPQCGAKVPKKTSVIMVIFLFAVVGIVFSSLNKGNELKEAAVIKQAASQTAQAAAWSYTTRNDAMTGKPTRSASLTSTNSLSLEFPYAGPNNGQLDVRQISGKADEVIFSIEKGQTLCKSYAADCKVMVRFDDAQPIAFAGQGPSDGSSTHVFLSPASRFIAEARKAKRIKVSLDIYTSGIQVLDFTSVAPLSWK